MSHRSRDAKPVYWWEIFFQVENKDDSNRFGPWSVGLEINQSKPQGVSFSPLEPSDPRSLDPGTSPSELAVRSAYANFSSLTCRSSVSAYCSDSIRARGQ
jgi:hypothetical protein